ncbi:hypothetical protein MMC30_005589 [Trapelia coarctata]|nr:hypothetical protein [Trapelia coarctata]
MSFPAIPTFVWICDRCSATNLQFSNPNDCSVCKHKRCSRCTVGTANPDTLSRVQNAPFDPSIIDRLTRDFEYRVNVGAVLVEENPDIPVSGGYDSSSTSLVKNPDRVFSLKHMWEGNPEMNNRSWLTNSGEQVHFGFKGEELVAAKALALDYRPIKPNNLDGPIHPIFRLYNWNNTPDDIYEVLKPGLRLATMFLSQERCMRWWSTILLGQREPDILGAQRTWHPAQRIKVPVPITPGNSFQAIEYLHEKGEDVVKGEGHLLSFRFNDKLAECGLNGLAIYGYTKKVGPWEGLLPTEKEWMDHFSKKKMHRTIVRLHGDFYREACKLQALKYPDENQKLRFYLFFAVCLCHEVAHAIEQADVYHGNDTPYFVPEPFIGDLWERESGNFWEKFTFGGIIRPINFDMSCKYGLCTQEWPGRPGESDWESTIYSIPMDWIEKIQQQEFWDDNEDILTGETQQELEEWLCPPRAFGTAKAWGCAVVFLMSESELNRAQHEDFKESLERKAKQDSWRERLKEEEERKSKNDPEDDIYNRVSDPQPLPQNSKGRNRSRSPGTEAEDKVESRKAETKKRREEP